MQIGSKVPVMRPLADNIARAGAQAKDTRNVPGRSVDYECSACESG